MMDAKGEEGGRGMWRHGEGHRTHVQEGGDVVDLILDDHPARPASKRKGEGETCQLSIPHQQAGRTHSRVLCFFTSSSVQLMMIVSCKKCRNPRNSRASLSSQRSKRAVRRSQESSPGNGKEKGPTKARHPLHLPAWLGNSSKPRTAARHCLSARSEPGPMKVATFDLLSTV